MANLVNPEYVLVKSGRRVVRWLRRLATRVLLVQVHAELAELRERQDRLERQLHALLGQHYDNMAVAQRLAVLEDRLREEYHSAEEGCEESQPPRKG
jgi:cell division protein FtsB